MSMASRPHSELRADIARERERRHWTIPQWRELYPEDWPGGMARVRKEADNAVDGLLEQKEAADRVLAVADQLAEWVRVTVKVEGVFSNNIGAQAQAQGLANLLTRYAAARDSYPASEPKP